MLTLCTSKASLKRSDFRTVNCIEKFQKFDESEPKKKHDYLSVFLLYLSQFLDVKMSFDHIILQGKLFHFLFLFTHLSAYTYVVARLPE